MNRERQLYFGEALRLGFPVISGILLAKFLSSSTYVDYFVVVSFVSIGVSIATFGLNLRVFLKKDDPEFFRIANLATLLNCFAVLPFLVLAFILLNPKQGSVQLCILLALELLYNGYYHFSNKLRSIYTLQNIALKFLIFSLVRFCGLFAYLQNQNAITLMCYLGIVLSGVVFALKGTGGLTFREYTSFVLDMFKAYAIGLTALLASIFDAFVIYLISTNLDSYMAANQIFLVKIVAVMMIFTHSQAFMQLTLENPYRKSKMFIVKNSASMIFLITIPAVALFERMFDFFPNIEINLNSFIFLLTLGFLRTLTILIGNRLSMLSFSRFRNAALFCGFLFLGLSMIVSKLAELSLNATSIGVLIVLAEFVVSFVSFVFLKILVKED